MAVDRDMVREMVQIQLVADCGDSCSCFLCAVQPDAGDEIPRDAEKEFQ
jgi:ferredoxin